MASWAKERNLLSALTAAKDKVHTHRIPFFFIIIIIGQELTRPSQGFQ